MSLPFRVACDYLCVPDGLDDKNDLQLSIQVSPIIYTGAPNSMPKGEDFIDVENWPEAISDLSREIEVYVEDDTGAHKPVGTYRSLFYDVMKSLHASVKKITRAEAAKSLWKKAFRYKHKNHSVRDFECLQAALTEAWIETANMRNESYQLAGRRSSDIGQFFETLNRARVVGVARAGSDLLSIWNEAITGTGVRAMAAMPNIESTTSSVDIADLYKARAEELSDLDRACGWLALGQDRDLGPISQLLSEALSEFSTAGEGSGISPPGAEDDTEGDWGSRPAEAGKRKLSAILSLPTLAHYLGCGAQVLVPRQDLIAAMGREPHEGLIRARFAGDPNMQSPWTAYSLAATATSGIARGFTPLSRKDLDDEENRFKGDFLRFSTRHTGSARYRMDAIASYPALTGVASRLRLDPNDEQAAAGEVRRRRGIAVYDRFSKQQLGEDLFDYLTRDVEEAKHTEDLFRGYRPDFAVVGKDGSVDAGRWRPVTQRRVICLDEEFDETFYTEQAVEKHLLSRDHGVAFAPEEVKDAQEDGDQWVLTEMTEDEMFVWGGESLAVTRSEQETERVDPHRTSVDINPLLDLGLMIKYEHDGFSLPPLREGEAYFVGARLCYANGSGPQFSPDAYADAELVLGETDEKGLTVRPFRYDHIEEKAPDIHLLWTEPVIRAKTLEEQKGEKVETAVIRDGDGFTRRVITPPRISFDEAEIQGQFDNSDEKEPDGAFSRSKNSFPALWLTKAQGSLPEARYGSIRYMQGELARDIEGGRPIRLDDNELSRPIGTVAVFVRSNKTESPYYVDGNATTLKLRLRDEAVKFDADLAIDFWSGDAPNDAVPVLVELRTGDAHSIARIMDAGMDSFDTGRRVKVPRIRVQLPEASRANLEAHCGNELVKRELVLVHAKARPTPPRFPQGGAITYGIRAVTVTVTEQYKWAQHVDAYENQRKPLAPSDMLDWESQAGGSTTFFVGRVGLAYREVGAISALAKWREYNTNTFRQIEKSGNTRIWVEEPENRSAQLFETEVEWKIVDNPEKDWLNLLRGRVIKTGRDGTVERDLRGLFYNFPDGRARRLEVTLTATSDFAEFYKKSDKVHSRTTTEMWVDCTFRPPSPVVTRTLPRFVWEGNPMSDHQSIRRTRIRIYLDDGWFASGEGEKMGVVLAPDNIPGSDKQEIGDPCDYYTQSLASFQRFLSRPGVDPSHLSGHDSVPLRLTERHFKAGTQFIPGRLYLADDESTVQDEEGLYLDTNFAVFEVDHDERDGPFVDIDFSLGDSYSPFLHLGLVRYQEHAVEELKVSNPIELIVSSLPERMFRLEKQGPKRWSAQVTGPTYTMSVDRGDGLVESFEPELVARVYGWHKSSYIPGYDQSWWQRVGDSIRLERIGPQVGITTWESKEIDLRDFEGHFGDYEDFIIQVEEKQRLVVGDTGEAFDRLVYSASLKV